MSDETAVADGWDDRTVYPNSAQATPHHHRRFAGIVLREDAAGPGMGAIRFPEGGVWAMLGHDPHEILSGFFEVVDAEQDPPRRYRYVFPATSVLYFIEDLGEAPEAEA